MALEALKAYSEAQSKQQDTKPVEFELEPKNKILTAHIDAEKHVQELYKRLSENIKISAQLRIKINKDIKAGADILSVLTDAIKCISLMTGDTVFYDQNISVLKEKYSGKKI